MQQSEVQACPKHNTALSVALHPKQCACWLGAYLELVCSRVRACFGQWGGRACRHFGQRSVMPPAAASS
eukprot:1140927-Alexandrium_andersonii.AAC.1